MLRAAKRIVFDKDRLISQNGILLSPVINLCGLVLRSDRPVPKEIREFLEGKGIQVKRVRYKGELYIRLCGNYNLSRTDLENFISKHTDLINEQTRGLEDVPTASHLQKEIADKINTIGERRVSHYQGTEYTYSIQGIIKSESIEIQTSKGYFNSGSVASHINTLVDSPVILEQGLKQNRIGFFSESLANKNMTLKSQTATYENALIDSGETLTINKKNIPSISSEEKLKLDSRIYWLNNPHPELMKKEDDPNSEVLLATFTLK